MAEDRQRLADEYTRNILLKLNAQAALDEAAKAAQAAEPKVQANKPAAAAAKKAYVKVEQPCNGLQATAQGYCNGFGKACHSKYWGPMEKARAGVRPCLFVRKLEN